MEDSGQLKRALVDSLAGAIAGGISRTVTSPMDVIKIRFQVQLEPTSSWALRQRDLNKPSKYTGILQATKDIYREEGLRMHWSLKRCMHRKEIYHSYSCRCIGHWEGVCMKWGFWRGNVPALLLYMPYAAIQFTTLHYLKTLAAGSSKTEDHMKLSPHLSFFSGALAGCAATIGSYPFDLLRTILASQGEPKVYPTMRSAFYDIIETRGIRGLYAGLSPTLVEIIPYAGLQFGSYDTFKRGMMAWNQYRFSVKRPATPDDYSLSSFQLFVCGLAAGTCAKAICHPLDVVKKRFQVEGLPRHPRYGARVESYMYKNMYHALLQIYHTEGWHGLYKGIFPSLLKSAPAGAITFISYEYTSEWLESRLA